MYYDLNVVPKHLKPRQQITRWRRGMDTFWGYPLPVIKAKKRLTVWHNAQTAPPCPRQTGRACLKYEMKLRFPKNEYELFLKKEQQLPTERKKLNPSLQLQKCCLKF
jgi:hypothetical protein